MPPSTDPAGWREVFVPYSPVHAVAVLVCFTLIIAVSIRQRHLEGPRGNPRGADRLQRAVAFAGIAYWVLSNTWWCWPTRFDLQRSLPLHICDLAGLLAPIAILWPSRRLRALVYFWGIALSMQGFVQPVLKVGAAHTEFWLFWANHTFAVGGALFIVVGLGFRPAFKDLIVAAALTLLYAAVMIAVNLTWGLNYGYVGNQHTGGRTLLDALGPWPQRLLPLGGIVIVAYLLVWSPMLILARIAERAPPPDQTPPVA